MIERCSFYRSAERVVPGTTPSWPVNFHRNSASVLRVVPLRSVKLKRIKKTYFKKAGIGQNGCFSTARSVLYPTTLSSSRCKKWHGVTARSVLYHFLWQAQYSRKNPSFFHSFERVVPHIVWQAQLKDFLMAGAKLAACCLFAV